MSQQETPDLSVLDQMPHLTQPTEEALKSVRKKIDNQKEEEQEKSDDENPKLKEEYMFDFEYIDGRKRRWSGKFKNRIVSVTDRQAIGALQAQWQLGLPHAAFDPDISGMNYVVAHMAISLTPIRGGEWAKDLRTITDTDLIQALYTEVAAHEATFHGRQPAQESSQASG